jgi:replicative DNA helicase
MVKHKLDYELFEYILAYNCTTNEIFTATIIDDLDLSFISNTHIRNYLKIIFDFYQQHQVLPSAPEIRSYLSTQDLKDSYKNVVIQFKSLDTKYNYDDLICNTEKYIKERAVWKAVKKTVNDYSDDTTENNIAETYELFNNACNISLVDDLGFDYLENIDEHIKNLNVNEKYISTGYRWFDKMLGGGWLEGGRALYMFLAGTNVGKSIFLGNIASKLLEQNKKILIVSLEMSEDIYSKRISAQISRIPLKLLKEEQEQLKKHLYQIKRNNPSAKLIIKEFPPSNISTNTLRAYIKKLNNKKKFKPDAIIIDYLTLMLAVNPAGSMYEDGKKVAEQARALSYPQFFGCPVISAGQLNRTGMAEANPELDKTGESVGIPQTADAIFMLWQSDAEKELGLINCGIKKNRFGVNFGSTAFKIEYDTLAIDEMEDVFGNNDIVDIENTLNRLNGDK